MSPWSNYLTISFVCFILIIMAMTPDMRLAVILGPIWLAVLAIMYFFKYRKKWSQCRKYNQTNKLNLQ